MGDRLENKVAIVTGAASGIGRETALRFAREGARVTLADRNRDGGEKTQSLVEGAGGEAHFVSVDVSKVDQVEEMVEKTVERFGGLDVLVNAARRLNPDPSSRGGR